MDWYITSLISMFSVLSGVQGKPFIFLTSEGTWNAVRYECSVYNGQLLTDQLQDSPNSCLEDMLSKTPSVWTGAHTQLTPYLIHKGCYEYIAISPVFQTSMNTSSVGECYRICTEQTNSDAFGIRNETECTCIGKPLPNAKSSYEKCLSNCRPYQNDRREYCGGDNAISLYVTQDTRSWDDRGMQPSNPLRCAAYKCITDDRTTQKENCSSKYQPYCGGAHMQGNTGYTFDQSIEFCASSNLSVGVPPEDCQHLQRYSYWVDIYRYQIPILANYTYAKEDGKEFQCGLLRNKLFRLSNCNSRLKGMCVTNTTLIPDKEKCGIDIELDQTTEGTPEEDTTLIPDKEKCGIDIELDQTTEGTPEEDPSKQTAIAVGIPAVIAALVLLGIVGAVAYRRRLCNSGKAPDVTNDNPAPQIEENYFVLEPKTTHNSNHKTGTIPKHHKTGTIPIGYEDIYVEHDEGEYDELNKGRPKIQNNAEDPGMYMHGNFKEETEGVYNYPIRGNVTEEDSNYSGMEGNTNSGHDNYGMMIEHTQLNGDVTYDHC